MSERYSLPCNTCSSADSPVFRAYDSKRKNVADLVATYNAIELELAALQPATDVTGMDGLADRAYKAGHGVVGMAAEDAVIHDVLMDIDCGSRCSVCPRLSALLLLTAPRVPEDH